LPFLHRCSEENAHPTTKQAPKTVANTKRSRPHLQTCKKLETATPTQKKKRNRRPNAYPAKLKSAVSLNTKAVIKMVYCSHCGAQVADGAYFCPKCGTKTAIGKTAKVNYPSDELQDAFYRVGTELERAFTMAAKETHAALKKASDNIQQKTSSTQTSQATQEGTVVCPHCGAKNVPGAIFCNSCGKKIAS
jgi:ribosomal protein L40E